MKKNALLCQNPNDHKNRKTIQDKRTKTAQQEEKN